MKHFKEHEIKRFDMFIWENGDSDLIVSTENSFNVPHQ